MIIICVAVSSVSTSCALFPFLPYCSDWCASRPESLHGTTRGWSFITETQEHQEGSPCRLEAPRACLWFPRGDWVSLRHVNVSLSDCTSQQHCLTRSHCASGRFGTFSVTESHFRRLRWSSITPTSRQLSGSQVNCFLKLKVSISSLWF